MKNNDDAVPGSENSNDALSSDILKSIVGGARPGENAHVDGEAAIGLTAGAEAGKLAENDAAKAGEAKGAAAEKSTVDVLKADTRVGEGGAFTSKLTLSAAQFDPNSKQLLQKTADVSISGVKGNPDGVKVSVQDQAGKTVELSAGDIALKAKAGDALYQKISDHLKELDGKGKKTDPNFTKDIEKGMRSTAVEVDAHLQAAKTYTKTTYKIDSDGNVEKETKSTKLDAEKAAADKAKTVAENTDKHTTSWDAQKADAQKAQEQKAKPQQDLDRAYKDLRDGSRAATGAADAVKTLAKAQDKAESDHKAATANLSAAEAKFKNAVADPKSDPSGKAGSDLVKAQMAHGASEQKVKATGEALKAGEQKLADARKAVDDAKAKVTSDDAGKKAMKSADSDDGRARSKSVDGSEKSAKKAEGEEGRERSKSVDGSAKGAEKPDETRPRANAITENPQKSTVDKAKDKIKEVAAEKGWKVATKGVEAMLNSAAKEKAKAENNLHESTIDKIVAGGVSKTVDTDGNKVRESTTVAQVKIEGGTTSYSSDLGKGASANWAVRAEAGKEVKNTTDLGDGKSLTTTNKVNASASFENKAGVTLTHNALTAEASTKVAVHAEANKSYAYKNGDVENTTTIGVAGDASAGAKAGVHLGYDGISASAKAVAEASIKAGITNETKVGSVTIEEKAAVYAAAKAEAKADAEVAFNPFAKDGKVKAKVGVGAEASAGVGAEGNVGLKSANGTGVEVGGGVYAGKVGAKFDGDVEFKDGKLQVGFQIGASLGIGASYNVNLAMDVGKATKNVAKAFTEIEDVGDAVLSPFKAVGGFFGGLFG